MIALTFFFVAASAHSWMKTPIPRSLAASQTSPCETQNYGPANVVTVGTALPTTWTHLHTGGAVVFKMSAGSRTPSLASLSTIETTTYDNNANGATAGFTIPATHFSTVGNYTLQWSWSGYMNCADLLVVNAPPAGATAVTGSPGIYDVQNGQYNALTGTMNCTAGYTASSDNTACNPSVDGGAVFGIILLVVVLLAIVGVVALLVYWKVKRPEKWENLKTKVGNVKSKLTSKKGGSSTAV